MKQKLERRKPEGLVDYLSIAITTVGVGYIPLAPGTWGSAVGVAIYLGLSNIISSSIPTKASQVLSADLSLVERSPWPMVAAGCAIALAVLCLVGIWAAGRSASIFGNSDPSQAVIDEVMGQLVTFCFVPFGIGWPFILAGFLLFRLFDIWKPFPARTLETLPGGLGICADDLVAGVYAGICLAVGYALYLFI